MKKYFKSDHEKQEYIQKFIDEIISLIENGYDSFMITINLYLEPTASKCLLEIKKEFPHIVICALVNGVDYEQTWTAKEQATFFTILSKYDKIVVVPDNFNINKNSVVNCTLPFIIANNTLNDNNDTIILDLKDLLI